MFFLSENAFLGLRNYFSKAPEKSVTPVKITIIGAGLVGLFSLVEIISKARDQAEIFFEIDVVEKRDLNFSRAQKIIMIKDRYICDGSSISLDVFCERRFFPDKSLKLNSDGDLLVNGKIPDQTFRYRIMQKIIRQRLSNSGFPINLSIKQFQKALLEQVNDNLPKNVILTWHLNSTVTHINLENAILSVSSKEGDDQEFFFDVLLNCEGEKRETVELINEAATTARLSTPFEYKAIESEETFHTAIKLKFNKPVAKEYEQWLSEAKEKYAKSVTSDCVETALHQSVYIDGQLTQIHKLPYIFDPNIYKASYLKTPWTPKLFFAGPIPKTMHEMKDPKVKRQILLEWASYILANDFKIAPENFVIDTKDNSEDGLRQRVSTFTSKIKAVVNPCMILPNRSVVALLGDAAMSPYYFLGRSSLFGLNESRSFIDCFFNEKILQMSRQRSVFDKVSQVFAPLTGFFKEPTSAPYTRFKEVYSVYNNAINYAVSCYRTPSE